MEAPFLNSLNPSQRMAVEYISGPSLVIAGAGSGKTRVLTYKIAYLLHKGVKPWSILALTFTNKAAREMKQRIALLVGEDKARMLWMGTFHSTFNRILRQEAEKMGYGPNYTIYQTSDSLSVVKAILKEMNLDDKVYKPSSVFGMISEAKNALVMPYVYCSDHSIAKRDQQRGVPLVGTIYKRYMQRLKQANAMDFDDLLLNTYLLLDQWPEVREKYASRFQFYLVDEYQDTNYAQYKILQYLTKENKHICVVGDDAQSIYSFRGARIDNILNFQEQYEGARLFKLEQNYRSSQNIVGAASSVIAKNKQQISKNIFSKNDKGQPLILNIAQSDTEEGEIVCNRIVQLHLMKHIPYGEMAILYRTNAQSRIFEEGLRGRMIPYRIYGGRSFYDQKEIRDILAYFRLIVNPSDDEALRRIINYPKRGIGGTTLSKLFDVASENEISVWQVLQSPSDFGLQINSGTLKKLQSFRDLMEGFIAQADTLDAYQLATNVVKHSGIWAEAYQSNDAENKSLQDNLSELYNGIHTFVEMQRELGEDQHISLSDYMNEIALVSDQDNQQTEGQDMVTLMTVHSAKGLEFDAVFIFGLEENLFPNAMSMYSPRELEEERRLFYVAITRAKSYCYLCCSKMRFHYGKMDFCEPSSFLKEIDSDYLRMELAGGAERPALRTSSGSLMNTTTPISPAYTTPRTLRPLVSNAEVSTEGMEHQSVMYNGQELKVGQTIEHERFGRGTVERIEGEPGGYKANIAFVNSGMKCLLLKYAKIKIIQP